MVREGSNYYILSMMCGPITSFLAVFNKVTIQASSSNLLRGEPLQGARVVRRIVHCQARRLTGHGWVRQKERVKENPRQGGQRTGQGEAEKEGVKTAGKRTNGHEGFGADARRGQADAVDGEHPHLVQDAFNHPLSFVCSRFVNVKVEFCPSGGALLLPLHEITWWWKNTSRVTVKIWDFFGKCNIVSVKLSIKSWGKKNPSLTFDWDTAIKYRGLPDDGAAVLSHACAFDILRGVGHIWNKITICFNVHQKRSRHNRTNHQLIFYYKNIHLPTIFTNSIALSSPAGLVTQMV